MCHTLELRFPLTPFLNSDSDSSPKQNDSRIGIVYHWYLLTPLSNLDPQTEVQYRRSGVQYIPQVQCQQYGVAAVYTVHVVYLTLPCEG